MIDVLDSLPIVDDKPGLPMDPRELLAMGVTREVAERWMQLLDQMCWAMTHGLEERRN
jgi:hypothetical protein